MSVRRNGSASAAAMSEVKTGKINDVPLLYCHFPFEASHITLTWQRLQSVQSLPQHL